MVQHPETQIELLLGWHSRAREISTEIAWRNVAGHIAECGGDLGLTNCD